MANLIINIVVVAVLQACIVVLTSGQLWTDRGVTPGVTSEKWWNNPGLARGDTSEKWWNNPGLARGLKFTIGKLWKYIDMIQQFLGLGPSKMWSNDSGIAKGVTNARPRSSHFVTKGVTSARSWINRLAANRLRNSGITKGVTSARPWSSRFVTKGVTSGNPWSNRGIPKGVTSGRPSPVVFKDCDHRFPHRWTHCWNKGKCVRYLIRLGHPSSHGDDDWEDAGPFCHCRGTGYHGVSCQLPGEGGGRGWQRVANKEYKIIDHSVTSFIEAQSICVENGGRLPEPEDMYENNLFADISSTGMLVLGLSDIATDGLWRYESDGTVITWSNWMNWTNNWGTEPNGGGSQGCAVMMIGLYSDAPGFKRGGWSDVDCGDLSDHTAPQVICERVVGPPPNHNPTTPSEGWNHTVNREYKVIKRPACTFLEAHSMCVDVGGRLPEPKTLLDNDDIAALDVSGMIVMGLSDALPDHHWRYESDGTVITWSKWMNWTNEWGTEPNGGGYQGCAVMMIDLYSDASGFRRGGWSDVDCGDLSDHTAPQVVCERDLN